MKFYLAPMEGMTGYVFRNAYAKYFHNVDCYYTPFIASTGLSHRELHDVLPEHNRGIRVVPQILTNSAADFLEIAERLEAFGYDEVNLNLGCPSGTVVSKGRGAGFLKTPDALDAFLEEIFGKCPLDISVKTRIGVAQTDEWERLQQIYNAYPIKELIVHPRLQKDYYRNPVHPDIFAQAAANAKMPVCYNGELHDKAAFDRFSQSFPEVDRVMFGRGVFKNPCLIGECRGEKSPGPSAEMQRIREMLEELLENYRLEMQNDTHALYKMKEFWSYFGERIPGAEKAVKRIKKAKRLEEYRAAAAEAFQQAGEF